MKHAGKDPNLKCAGSKANMRAVLLTAAAAIVGLALIVDSARWSSATYDEVIYLEIACKWWRTGETIAITRMGSPLTFWKLQQAPMLWLLDHTGRGAWIDDPIGHQSEMLPQMRWGAAWIYVSALLLTAAWARAVYGNCAMVLAAWMFALGPNLLAHGALLTMELPVTAAFTASLWAFWCFSQNGRRIWFGVSALFGGLAFSCKFTAVLLPPLVAAAWIADALLYRYTSARVFVRIGLCMLLYGVIMIVADLAITGFAVTPLSERVSDHPALVRWLGPTLGAWVGRLAELPMPQDLVAFVIQFNHQRTGGPSYLLGERAMHGWRHYYLIAALVKVPLGVFFLLAARAIAAFRKRRRIARNQMFWLIPLLFCAAASLGSARNYGFRYLLPVAPLAIVWISGLAAGTRLERRIALLGTVLIGAATASCYPHTLTYFNLIGRLRGGRHILADSNLDWGQGARAMARLQVARPELRDLTLYYFGSTDPAHYGVVGVCHVIDAGTVHPGLPTKVKCDTRYLAVSSSLRWGPWGPPGYFAALDNEPPIAWTDDGTIAVYRKTALDRNAGEPGQADER